MLYFVDWKSTDGRSEFFFFWLEWKIHSKGSKWHRLCFGAMSNIGVIWYLSHLKKSQIVVHKFLWNLAWNDCFKQKLSTLFGHYDYICFLSSVFMNLRNHKTRWKSCPVKKRPYLGTLIASRIYLSVTKCVQLTFFSFDTIKLSKKNQTVFHILQKISIL